MSMKNPKRNRLKERTNLIAPEISNLTCQIVNVPSTINFVSQKNLRSVRLKLLITEYDHELTFEVSLIAKTH